MGTDNDYTGETMMPNCIKCDTDMGVGGGYCYTDKERNLHDAQICWRCLLKHCEQYYGDCPNSRHLRMRYESELEENPIPKPDHAKQGQQEIF